MAFTDVWESWYRGTNAIVTSETEPSPSVANDIIRTQFEMLDAIVAIHASCVDRLCPDKQVLRRILEARQ